MTKVIHLASPRAGTRVARTVQTHAHPVPTTDNAPRDPVARQAAIENALTMALYFIRQPTETGMEVFAATARTNRALSLLKQASKEFSQVRGVAENALQLSTESGRA